MTRKLCAIVASLFVATLGWAQATGEITGVVTDSAKAVVPGARVTAVHAETGAVRSTASSEAGIYRLAALPVGTYQLKVEKQGFNSVVVMPIILYTATVVRTDAELQVSAVQEVIEVRGVSPLLQVETGTGSAVIDARAVETLPLRVGGANPFGFRDPVTLAGLTPGVTGAPGTTANAFSAHVSGGRGFGQELLLDGAPNTGFAGVNSALFNSPVLETIREFKVILAVPPAEYGRTDAGMITMSSKSGTRELHGSVWEMMRNEAFDARPVFAQRRGRTRLNEFGTAIGGPVYIPKLYPQRDRTFFFFNYSGFRFSGRSGAEFRTIPTLRMRQGDFSEWPRTIYDPLTNAPATGGVSRTPFNGNVIPRERLSPLALRYQALLPEPNQPGVINNFVGNFGRINNQDAYFIKGDHDIIRNNRLNVSYRHKKILQDNGFMLTPVLDGVVFNFPTKHWIITDDHVFSPSLLNHFQFAYQWTTLVDNCCTGKDVGFQVPGTFSVGVPLFNFNDGYPGAGFNTWRQSANNNFNWQNTVSWIKSKHNYKMGVRIARYGHDNTPRSGSDDSLPCRECPGRFNFSNLGTGLPNAANRGASGNAWASLLLGFTDQGLALRETDKKFRTQYYALFFQDDYKLTPRFTLNYGLRWEMQKPYYEVAGQVSPFNLSRPNPAAAGLLGAAEFYGTGTGRVGRNEYLETFMGGFGPRVGLAYQIRNNTVIRAAGGILHGPQRLVGAQGPPGAGFDDFAFAATTDTSITPALWLDQGFRGSQRVLGGTFDPALYNGRTANFFDTRPNGSGRLPTTYQYTFAVQQLLPGEVSLDVAYVGTIGKHLATHNLERPNQLPVARLALGSLLNENITSARARAAGFTPPYSGFNGTVAQSLRPWPHVLDLWNPAATAGNSSYHAMQVKVEKSYAKGLQFSLAYSTSKTISDSDMFDSEFTFWGRYPGARDQFNRRLEKSISAHDTPQRVAISVLYDLPFGPRRRFLNSGLASKLLGGWGVSGILTYQSGQSIRVWAPNTLGIFTGLQTANRVEGKPMGRHTDRGSYNPWTDRYLNAEAFAVPAPFTLGTLGAVIPDFRAFGLRNEDISLIKRFFVTETVRGELHFSFFNALNRHGWGYPNTNPTSLAFGQILSAQGPRLGQLELKIAW